MNNPHSSPLFNYFSQKYTTGIRTFETYDGMGRLTRVSVPQVGDPDTYAWTPNGYAPMSGSYTWNAAGTVYYTHADYQGSIIAVTDSAGTVVQTTNYCTTLLIQAETRK